MANTVLPNIYNYVLGKQQAGMQNAAAQLELEESRRRRQQEQWLAVNQALASIVGGTANGIGAVGDIMYKNDQMKFQKERAASEDTFRSTQLQQQAARDKQSADEFSNEFGLKQDNSRREIDRQGLTDQMPQVLRDVQTVNGFDPPGNSVDRQAGKQAVDRILGREGRTPMQESIREAAPMLDILENQFPTGTVEPPDNTIGNTGSRLDRAMKSGGTAAPTPKMKGDISSASDYLDNSVDQIADKVGPEVAAKVAPALLKEKAAELAAKYKTFTSEQIEGMIIAASEAKGREVDKLAREAASDSLKQDDTKSSIDLRAAQAEATRQLGGLRQRTPRMGSPGRPGSTGDTLKDERLRLDAMKAQQQSLEAERKSVAFKLSKYIPKADKPAVQAEYDGLVGQLATVRNQIAALEQSLAEPGVNAETPMVDKSAARQARGNELAASGQYTKEQIIEILKREYP